MFKSLPKDLKVRVVTDFLRRMLSYSLLAFMAIYLSQQLGEKLAGVLIAGTVLASIISSIYGGHVTEKVNRKPVLVFLAITNVVAFGTIAAANSTWWHSVVVTYIMYLIQSVISSGSTPAADAMIIERTDRILRQYIYRINYILSNVAFALGGALGALYFRRHLFDLLFAATLVELLALCLILLYIGSLPVVSAAPQRLLSSYQWVVSHTVFMRFVVASACIMAIEYQLSYYISVRLDRHFGTQVIARILAHPLIIHGVAAYGFLRAENAILVIVLALFVHRFTRGIRAQWLLLGGIAIFTIGYMTICVSNNFTILVLASLVYTVGEIVSVPVKQALLTTLVDGEMRTQFMAVYSLHYRAGQLFASFCIVIGSFVSSKDMAAIYGMLGSGALYLFYSVIRGVPSDTPAYSDEVDH